MLPGNDLWDRHVTGLPPDYAWAETSQTTSRDQPRFAGKFEIKNSKLQTNLKSAPDSRHPTHGVVAVADFEIGEGHARLPAAGVRVGDRVIRERTVLGQDIPVGVVCPARRARKQSFP